jgi:hypothetical protein
MSNNNHWINTGIRIREENPMLHRHNAMTEYDYRYEPRNENDRLSYVVYSRRFVPPPDDESEYEVPTQADNNFTQLDNNNIGGFNIKPMRHKKHRKSKKSRKTRKSRKSKITRKNRK